MSQLCWHRGGDLINDLDSTRDNSAAQRQAQVRSKRANLQAQLDLPHQQFLAAVRAQDEWLHRREILIGTIHDPETIEGITHQLRTLDLLPGQEKLLQDKCGEKIRQIYESIRSLANEYQLLYRPVQEFIRNHPIAAAKLQLTFDVRIIDRGFQSRFFEFLHQGIAGTFYGGEDGRRTLKNLLDQADLQSSDGLLLFLREVLRRLKSDYRQDPPIAVQLPKQLRADKDQQGLYDFLFGLDYLEPKYVLRWGGRELSQLSPGEKGALLLVFYLLVDQRTTPLVLDQPEDNLDNETVYELLVPAIQEARSRRQIIIVTHNPNLAVVTDADQVICARQDKVTQRITYTSGSLENPAVTKSVVNVLEGTRPAFRNRDRKYTINP